MDKFDQIKLFLLEKLGKPQFDVLLLNETFLKPNVPDTFFEVLGYSIKFHQTPESCKTLSDLEKVLIHRMSFRPSLVRRCLLCYNYKLTPRKAAGIDKISSLLLRIGAPVIAPVVARLINFSFSSGSFPSRCKTTKVSPLYKNGDSRDVQNFLPISAPPVLSKVIERHVHDSLYSYLTENNLIYPRQSGFRKNHRTDTALIQIINEQFG